MIQRRSYSLSFKVKQNSYDTVEIRLIMKRNVNVFNINLFTPSISVNQYLRHNLGC